MALKQAMDFGKVLREFQAIAAEEREAEGPDNTARLMQDLLAALNGFVHPETEGQCPYCQLVGRVERWLVANGAVPSFVFNDGR